MKTLGKIIKTLLNIVMSLIIIIGIALACLFLVGVKPYVVESDSMKPKFEAGDICFINTKTDYKTIKEKDIIAFKLTTGKYITHRVIKITDEGLETKGDANNVSDGISTTEDNYIGKNVFSLPKLGFAIKAIQTTKGKIIGTTIVIILLILGFVIGEPSKKNKEEK